MLVPLKLILALRPSVAPALLAAIGSSTVVFVASPFLLAGIADERQVSLGAVGWISTTQLAGFVASSWAAGRFLQPVRSVFIGGALLGIAANLASAIAPTLAVLAITRLFSGFSLGLAAWFAWQAAFGDSAKTGDVAVVGPLVGMVTAPAVSLAIQTIGVDWLFVLLAAVAGSPLLLAHKVPRLDRLRPHQTRHAATRAAKLILSAFGLLTVGASSVFIYAAVIGQEFNGMSPLLVSLLFSANSVAGIPAAKWGGRRGSPGFWFLGTAIMAILMASVRNDLVFSLALVGWGFAFFMAIPAAFNLLASRSAFPSERAGDAQAVMALGRVFGPLLGGALIASGSVVALGFTAGAIMATAASMLLYADRHTLPLIGSRFQ